MMSTNNTMRMTDMTIEETSTAESRQSSMTVPMTTSSETTIMQTSGMNDLETGGGPEEVENITKILEIITEEMTPIK